MNGEQMKNYLGVTFNDARDALYQLAKNVPAWGAEVSPRGMRTFEVRNATIEIIDTSDCLAVDMGRRFNSGLAAVEALSLIGGCVSEGLLVAASPRYLEFVGGAATGAYGPRIRRQMPHVIDALRRDPDTRQALVTIWDPQRDLLHEHGDRPCTTQIGFTIRDGRLITNTQMRSQDVYLGFTYDVVMFTQLHHTVANVLGVEPGPLIHQVRSLHVYERDLSKLDELTRPAPEPRCRLSGLVGTSWHDVMYQAQYLLFNDGGVEWKIFNDTERWFVTQVRAVHAKALASKLDEAHR